MVNIYYEDTEILDLDPEFFVSWLSKVCVLHNGTLGDLSIVFCSDDYLLEMNKEYLDHDYYTDIISFDYSEGSVVAGDLFISVDRVYDNANTLNVSRETELNRVVVHGVLHLLGFQDKANDEAQQMRRLEDAALKMIVSRET